MRLYHSSQVSQNMGLKNKKDRHHCWMITPHQVIENQQQQEDDLIQPRKLINPVLASVQHRALHQELLFCYRRGTLPRRKPELQRVLEHKKREQLRKREQALCPPSDLEVKLHRRQQRMQFLEMEEKRRMERQKNLPEFVRVRQTLKHI
ncbi:protein FAM107B [Oryzias melastigma]|uniref:Protein FAM107B-like n=1 Tax=Oryzias melastigma TaxID=30732 RepID=A0A3B3CIR3_ORYME|nr:protein FAM107B [Oryzias melastigma]